MKVALKGIRPPIWRRFLVRDDVTLLKLHELLQGVMGWTDSHLHQFIVGGSRFNLPEFDLPPPRKDERKARLRDVLQKPDDRLTYEYDFGDSWEHAVILEEIRPHSSRARYPVILDGKRACPPEDCGGVPGYAHLLGVLATPKHPEHQDLVEWVGGKFDPEAFDVGEINRAYHGGWYLPEEEAPAASSGRGQQPSQGSLQLGAKPRRC